MIEPSEKQDNGMVLQQLLAIDVIIHQHGFLVPRYSHRMTFSHIKLHLPCLGPRRGTLGGTQYRNTVRKNGKYRNTASKIV